MSEDNIFPEIKWKWWEYLLIPFWRLKGILVSWYYRIKYLFQRLFRGYSDRDVFDLGATILDFAYPKVKAFIKMEKCGYPCSLDKDKWDETLKKIELAFDHWKLDEDCQFKYNTFDELYEHYQIMEEGFTLFGKYLQNFWD